MLFISRCLSLSDSRLPCILAKEAVRQNACWVAKWHSIANSANIEPLIEFTTNTVNTYIPFLLEKLEKQEFQLCQERAQSTTTHDLYPYVFSTDVYYFIDEFSAHQISLVFRARGGLLNINARTFKNVASEACPVCNLGSQKIHSTFLGHVQSTKTYAYTALGRRF